MASNDTDTQTRQRAKITVSGDALSATLMLIKPHQDEPPISVEEVTAEIGKAEVIQGIDHEAIEKCVDTQDYHNPVVIARGKKPTKGENSRFEYRFDTSGGGKPKEDEAGRMDYKNISYIQNIEKDAVLVTKIPPAPGVPGVTVKGKELKAPTGADIPFRNGKNTHVSDDGLSLLATKSGAIMYSHGTVAVNDLTIIGGDVDHTTGNIDCRGSVRVTGSIKAGFGVTIDGDLEVRGNVEQCQLKVGGSISVSGGFFGKRSGLMQAGADISVKYAEGQRIVSGGSIKVDNEIINCDIMARESVTVKGKKGKIVGGIVRCRKEVKASFIGSDTGTLTHIHVAYDPQLMKKHRAVLKEIERLDADGERVKEGLYALYRLQQDGKLPPDKKKALAALEEFQKDLPDNQAAMDTEKETIEEKLREAEDATVVAEDTLYPGVTIHFGIVYKEINKERSNCKITIEDNVVRLSNLDTLME